MKKFIFIFSFLFLLYFCGIEQYVEPEYLNPPFDLIAFPKDNKIKLQFYSNNSEEKFDGFNIYISTTTPLKNLHLLPVKQPGSGSIPTISRTSKDIDPNKPIEVTIELDASDENILNSTTYYLFVKSHSIRNYKSEPSNESSTTPRPEGDENDPLYENQGFNFNTLRKKQPYNFIFKRVNNKLCLIAGSGNLIQSMGYYNNWELINMAPEEGYVNSTVPLQVKEGYVFIIKTDDNRYGKIQIKEVKTGANPYIKYRWAYQRNQNNRDI